MAIDPIGAVAANATTNQQERIHVPVTNPLPPAQPTQKHRGSDMGTTGDRAGHRQGGRREAVSSRAMKQSAEDVLQQIEEAEQDLTELFQRVNQRLSFQLHEESDRMMVLVVDTQTDEVIKELPPEKLLDTIAKMREFIGLLFDDWI